MKYTRILRFALPSVLCLTSAFAGAAPIHPAGQEPEAPRDPATLTSLVGVAFEENLGQGPAGAAFVARTAAGTLALAADEGWLLLPSDPERCEGAPLLRWRLLGASPAARAEAEEPLPGVVSHLRGSDPQRWVRRARTFGRVRFHEVWPGIDAIHSGAGRSARYDFELAPLADPGVIRIAVEGAEVLRIDEEGALVLEAGGGELRQAPPVIYQAGSDGREAIEGGFVLLGKREFGFRIQSYDPKRTLVIDPTLSFSSLFGDLGNERATCVLTDGAGGWWVGGHTSSSLFPFSGETIGPVFGTDGFVLHFDAAGAVVETILVGGSNRDSVVDIALGTDVLYIAGNTSSADFPATVGVYQGALMGPSDAFVMKLETELLTPVYSTYYGGSGADTLRGFAVDASAEPVLVGETTSTDFPVAGGLDQLLDGTSDAFAARLQSHAGSPFWSGYWGGADRDVANAVALDPDSTAVVVGERNLTSSDSAAFVLPILSDGALGSEFQADGTSFDAALDVVAYGTDFTWVCGTTYSADFPLEQPFQGTFGGSSDAFLLSLDSLGLLSSTYWGGSGADEGVRFFYPGSHGYLLLNTESDDLPVEHAVSVWPSAGRDAYVVDLGLPGGTVRWATYLPGGDDERAFDLALDAGALLAIVGEVGNSAEESDQPADDARGTVDGLNNTSALLQVYSPGEAAGSGSVFFARDHDRASYGVPYEFFVYRKNGNDQTLSISFRVYDNEDFVPGLDGTLDFAAGEQVARGEVTFPVGVSASPVITLGSGPLNRAGSLRFMTLGTTDHGDEHPTVESDDGDGCSSWFGGSIDGPRPWHRGIQNAWWIAAVFALLLMRRQRLLARAAEAQRGRCPQPNASGNGPH